MRSLTVCLLGLAVSLLSVGAGERTNGRKVNDVSRHYGSPCYVEVSNELSDDTRRREIRVLMDKADVNEANFVNLQRHFSTMYQNVEHLTVRVDTSLSFRLGNYQTAEDIEALRAVLAGLPYDRKPKVWEKDAQGILIRKGEMEKFGYKGEGGDVRDMKYFLLKGDDPDCRDCQKLSTEPRDDIRTMIPDSRKSRGHVPCYFAFGNAVIDGRRIIGVFINADDGSEANLRTLLSHFSRQYAEAEPLAIRVYTNLKQKDDFVAPILGNYVVPAMYENFAAVLFRDSINEVIRYRRPNERVITVVVRGIDIFPDL